MDDQYKRVRIWKKFNFSWVTLYVKDYSIAHFHEQKQRCGSTSTFFVKRSKPSKFERAAYYKWVRYCVLAFNTPIHLKKYKSHVSSLWLRFLFLLWSTVGINYKIASVVKLDLAVGLHQCELHWNKIFENN